MHHPSPALPLLRAPELGELSFDNSFVRELPADPRRDPRRRQVEGACYSFVSPTPVPAPRLVAHSPEVAALLGLPERAHAHPDFARVFGGNALLGGMQTYAACYGGHQFGHWAGQLGDGRAIGLGEVLSDTGRWELQLKGAGPTPYSRSADGRAVMRSSVREFLCSEAMHHLGVPTTRALSLVATGEQVVRDMFYDGRPQYEPGAVVCRVAPSFLRFGSYQLLAARGDERVLRQLLDYTLRTHFAHLGAPGPETYAALLGEVAERTAVLMVEWQRVGFVHGVMNTDNMSVLGLTIDYGPYGWLEDFDPSWTPNTTDAQGRRYCYGNQANIALWNLARFAEALSPVVQDTELLERALTRYPNTFERRQRAMMCNKLGLLEHRPDEDDTLFADLFEALTAVETDMTLFFRGLANVPAHTEDAQRAAATHLREAFYDSDALTGEAVAPLVRWLSRYLRRVGEQGLDDPTRRQRMNAVNPKFVLRNYLAQLAINDAERGDPARVTRLLDVMRRPYDEQPKCEEYAQKRPEWARHRPGCSMLSCSS